MSAVEEKYGKNRAFNGEDDDSEDSQEGVEEDDDGELVTEDLDQEISATLQALRNKDPRIYDSKTNFFRPVEEGAAENADGTEKEPSMTLKQYHTKNLLEGKFGEEDDTPKQTYAQEQEDIRQNLVKEAQAADEDSEDDFLVTKSKSEPAPKEEKRVKITVQDVENADKDPETFLSNFMASRAWVPMRDARFQPLESDDDEEDAAADEYEASYNMYFEDTAGANEKLVTYARDVVAKTTVRRDEKSGRKKARDVARAKREAERLEREEDLARLRKLKVDEMENKVRKIREVGGFKGRDFKMDEWKDVLEGDWSDDAWDKEMQKRFGDAYYDDNDMASESEDEDSKKKKKAKKPKFDDDIDIKDLVPDFKDDDEEKPDFDLSDDEDDEAAEGDEDEDDDEETSKSKKSAKQRKQERADAKSAARRDRRLIENLVNENLQYEAKMATTSKKAPKGFRYRETSPTTFGMTPRDILLASDKQLNEFAGLKKLAAFRDPAKKKKDKKQLSKKARLRQWRQETFGDAEGPKGGFETIIAEGDEGSYGGARDADGDVDMNIREGREDGKRKRKRKGKKSAGEA